jgi:predicted nucleotidyltransferase
MTTIQFPTEFSGLLTLLNDHDVRYLVVGGYAVTYHGYPRTTGDLDLWIEQTETNADRVVDALRAFGFDVPTLESTLFLEKDRIVRMGRPPLRVEIFSSVSGVDFAPCYDERVIDELDGVEAAIIGLECLKKNKRASGRHEDLDDLEHLP